MLSVKDAIMMIFERLSGIGETYYKNEDINVTANVDSYVEGAAIKLPKPGVYVVVFKATFPTSNTDAGRRVQLYNKDASASVVTCGDYDKGWTAHSYTWVMKVTRQQGQNISVRASAGVALNNVATNIWAVRIR